MMKGAATVGCLMFFLALSGCSQKQAKAPVSGKVTYNAKPVTVGRITFISNATGQPGFSDLGADGSYRLEAPVGECKIAISSREQEPPPDSKGTKEARPGMFIGKSFIPEKYENHMQSELTFTVQKGDNTANFDLKD